MPLTQSCPSAPGRAGRAAFAVAAAVALASCGATDLAPQVAQDIRQQLAGSPPAEGRPEVWDDARRFYEQRAFAPRWIRDGSAVDAAEALRVVRRAPEHGLDASAYGEADLARLLTSAGSVEEALGRDAGQIARFDVQVTTSLLALGRDVALGRTSPGVIDERWKARREAPDLTAALRAAADAGELATWLDRVRPRHPEYAALQKALTELHARGDGVEGDRARTLAINLERWRWLPDDLGDRHILVNIPAFHLAVREQGRPALEMKVIVGTVERRTPVFGAVLNEIVFSPYWNVPDSIAQGETVPAARLDPGFLARNHYEVLRRNGPGGVTVVEPDSIDWKAGDAVKSLAFRQRPGEYNALGLVKFLFPNPYDVYLHDTPARALFGREGRAFSHGCVRIEKPAALASYLLRDRPDWDAARIEAAMHQDDEQHVALVQKLPVHVVYFTAWPDGAGGVETWPDVYGYDARQSGGDASRGRVTPKLD